MSRDLTLVTGFPRLLAKLIVKELVARDDGPVALLVRERFLDDARRYVDTLGAGSHASVSVIEGDVTSIDLGLPGADYLNLAGRVKLVHHAAQSTWEGAEAKSVRALNIQGTHEVIELARTARGLGEAPRVVAYSSTLVAGDHEGLVQADSLELGQGFRSEVERSLHQAERMLRRAELPLTILRPSIMVGHSETGEIDVFDGPYLFVLLLLSSPVDITLPLPSRGEILLNLVPVDYVARAGVVLGAHPEAVSKSFHLVDPHPLPARRVFEAFARAAGRRLPRGFIPINITRALLRTPGLERFARSPRAFVERMAARTIFPAEGARVLLDGQGIACPPFEKYADTLVDYVRRRLASRRTRPDAVAPEPEIDDPLA